MCSPNNRLASLPVTETTAVAEEPVVLTTRTRATTKKEVSSNE